MAWGGSGWYADTMLRALGTTALALDLDLDTHKLALYGTSITPDFSASNPQYSTTGEIVGTGYVAGGAVIGNTTLAVASGLLAWDGDNVQWTSSTLTSVRGANAYADALTDNNLIVGIDFVSTYSTADGTLLVSWSGSGIARVDWVP